MSSRLMIIFSRLEVVDHSFNEVEQIHVFQTWPDDIRVTAVNLKGREPFEFFRLRMQEWELQDEVLKDSQELTLEKYTEIRKLVWG